MHSAGVRVIFGFAASFCFSSIAAAHVVLVLQFVPLSVNELYIALAPIVSCIFYSAFYAQVCLTHAVHMGCWRNRRFGIIAFAFAFALCTYIPGSTQSHTVFTFLKKTTPSQSHPFIAFPSQSQNQLQKTRPGPCPLRVAPKYSIAIVSLR